MTSVSTPHSPLSKFSPSRLTPCLAFPLLLYLVNLSPFLIQLHHYPFPPSYLDLGKTQELGGGGVRREPEDAPWSGVISPTSMRGYAKEGAILDRRVKIYEGDDIRVCPEGQGDLRRLQIQKRKKHPIERMKDPSE